MIDDNKLQKILENHGKWLLGKKRGTKAYLREADLRRADLREADLIGANLREANLSGANLMGANLREANLSGANLSWANLNGAYLTGAYLSETDLRWAYLRGAYLSGADLRRADLRWADLREANLSGANLSGADLMGADLMGADLPTFKICPPSGGFIGWKKANGAIIKLEIPWFARRTSSIVGRKCRAELVFTLEIEKDNKTLKSVGSDNDSPCIYTVGEFTVPDSYDPDPRLECTHGIHFFITKQEALDW